MEGHLKSMKREGESNEALISPKTMLVSPRFMFRFMPSGRCRERSFALLFRRFRGREFLEARIVRQRVEHGIEPEERKE
jgi:hypothetical protein